MAQTDSRLNYRSECFDISSLEKIVLYHKEKAKIINIIQQGSRYHIDPIEEETRKSDSDAMILRGNHKSSHLVLNPAALDKSIRKNIDHGWALPLTIEYLQTLKMQGSCP